MSYSSLESVITDPMFPRVDTNLRRGKHITPDIDSFMFDFVTGARSYLEQFYESYSVRLVCGQEGYFYLVPDRSAVPPPLGSRKLSIMDMLAGQAIALMRLDPKWLATSGRIPDMAVLELLEHILGEDKLLRQVGRRRGKDVDQDARKLREALVKSLGVLEKLGFIRREGRGESACLVPLLPIMRFADPVRSSEALDDALERLIAEGEIDEVDDEPGEGDNELPADAS